MLAQCGDSADAASALVDVLKQAAAATGPVTLNDAVALLVGTHALLGSTAAAAGSRGSPFTLPQVRSLAMHLTRLPLRGSAGMLGGAEARRGRVLGMPPAAAPLTSLERSG
jgi:hypothetical protein